MTTFHDSIPLAFFNEDRQTLNNSAREWQNTTIIFLSTIY